ncbi:MAG: tautomerase family protein [Helicobacteraceae bacterium]|jgi:4-oxalocrotonate tautomerase|nr:tautomerase family protein [Helicobacteraceae bacterium]
MPYINVRVASKLTIEQKRAIAKAFSETMERVANKPKPSCYIVFDEVERENWAKGETILSDLDKAETDNDA